MQLRDRVALVTGAGRRVGRAIALALAGQGMRLALHYNRSEAGARETMDEIARLGGASEMLQADLARPDAPDALVAAVVDTFGALDVLVNSAAVMLHTPFGEVAAADWDAMFALNLRAPFFLTQAAAPHLRRGRGAVVNIADLAAFETWPGYVPHGISKAGVVQMTRALARVLAPDVRVNGVAPGAVLLPEEWPEESAARLARTTPLGRLGSPDDVVRAVRYLLEADYVTGETLVVDGGRHVRA
jgi:pteridine reductase